MDVGLSRKASRDRNGAVMAAVLGSCTILRRVWWKGDDVSLLMLLALCSEKLGK